MSWGPLTRLVTKVKTTSGNTWFIKITFHGFNAQEALRDKFLRVFGGYLKSNDIPLIGIVPPLL
jgi:hypothetical protein